MHLRPKRQRPKRERPKRRTPAGGASAGGGTGGTGPSEERPAPRERGTPVGRRVVLGMLGLGALGIAFGKKAEHVVADALAPLRSAGVADLLPDSGGFVLYTVTGGYPAPPPDYHLTVTGMVERPLKLSVADLEQLPPTRLTRDFQCVTGWEVDDVHWVGVRLTELAEQAGASRSATAFHFTSFDGVYFEDLTVAQAEESGAIVAYSMLGAPVTRDHGGPVRLYVPGMFGYKSIKWLSTITLTDRPGSGYWEQYGYPIDAWIDGRPPATAA